MKWFALLMWLAAVPAALSQELLPAVAYKVSGGNRSGLRIQVSPDRAPITLRHAFRATLKSGHAGVFSRARHLETAFLDGAAASHNTRWPAAFDARAHGVHLQD